MNNNAVPAAGSSELLECLRLSAESLLLAWHHTENPALWMAFEKATDACIWFLYSKTVVVH